MQQLIDLLHQQECSLVVKSKAGEVTTYNKKGVRDLVWLLDHDAERLRGAVIADKVIGKAAAGLIVQGGVVEAYADVMSRLALPLLDEASIAYRYGQLVDHIVIPEGDTRCPLERIVAPAQNAAEVESLLRGHFAEMKKKTK
jgi:hypothetical protein